MFTVFYQNATIKLMKGKHKTRSIDILCRSIMQEHFILLPTVINIIQLQCIHYLFRSM